MNEIHCKKCGARLCDVNELGWFEFKTTESRFKNWHIVFDRAAFKCPQCNTVWVLDKNYEIPVFNKLQINYLEYCEQS